MSIPEKNEYGEWFAGYVSLVPEKDILAALTSQIEEFQQLAASILEEKGAFSYADGKWTIKELLGHLNDGERIFAYRALRIARGDQTPLSGFEQDDYIAAGRFNSRTLADLIEEFVLLRRSNIKLFENLEDAAWLLMGKASGNPNSVRAVAYIMAGHVRHHLNILRHRYLA